MSEQLGQWKGIGPALEISQSHTIEYGVKKIVVQRYSQGNKSPAILRSSAARTIAPVCAPVYCMYILHRCAITAPRVTSIGALYGTGRLTWRGCIGLLLILYSIHNTATDRRWARSHSNTPPVKKLAPPTIRSSSLMCVLAAEHHTAEQ